MITDRIGRQKLVINHNNDNFQEQINVTKGKKYPRMRGKEEIFTF